MHTSPKYRLKKRKQSKEGRKESKAKQIWKGGGKVVLKWHEALHHEESLTTERSPENEDRGCKSAAVAHQQVDVGEDLGDRARAHDEEGIGGQQLGQAVDRRRVDDRQQTGR